jgi:hypothetical protein
MLGFIGRWAASKGMKLLPNWIGVDKTTAQTDIVAQGFKVGTVTQSDSTDAAQVNNHNKVISQTPAAATPQDYETSVNVTWRSFSFTPFSVFSFSPFGVFGFSPFSVFGFSPFSVFGFSPFSVFGFSPFAVFGFSPFSVFSFSPVTRCIDGETLIAIPGPNNTILYKPAKDIKIGDDVCSATWDELIDESFGAPYDDPSATLTNATLNTTRIVSAYPSIKATTMYFNNDITKRFSMEEQILIKRDSMWQFVNSATVNVGDTLLTKNENHTFDETPVIAIDIIDGDRQVYMFDCEPTDTLIAGDIVVHNYKVFN